MSDTPEEMKAFFDARIEGYDEHMAESLEDFPEFYSKIATPFPITNDPINVLDLGAGTGIELEFIFAKASNARITVVDLSEVMLDKLVEKHESHTSQIRTHVGFYLTMQMETNNFDFIVSVMSLHHLFPDEKTSLYKKIKNALVPGGTYVEGDYIVSPDDEERHIEEYHAKKEEYNLPEDALYHIDIPFSEKTQVATLKHAGFGSVHVLFRTSKSNVVVAKPLSQESACLSNGKNTTNRNNRRL